MFSLFRALKVRYKLLILFGVLALSMIFTTGREFYFFLKFDENFSAQQRIRELHTQVSLLSIHFNKQTEYLKQLNKTDNEASLQNTYYLYQNEVNSILQILAMIDELLINTEWSNDLEPHTAAIHNLSIQLASVHQVSLKSFVENVYRIKLELMQASEYDIYQKDQRIGTFEMKINSVIEQADTNLREMTSLVDKFIQYTSDKYDSFLISLRIWTLLLWIFGLTLLFFLTLEIGRTISKPIIRINEELEEISRGNIPPMFVPRSTDEIAQLYNSSNAIKDRFLAIRQIAHEIGNGNFHSNIDVNFEDGSDMRNTLDRMKQSLAKYASEREMQKVKDDIRNWQAVGLAKFSDILRLSSADFKSTSDKLVSELISYLDVNQVGMFIRNDSDPEQVFLELLSWYAYDRKRIRQKKVLPGEGLIGITFIEGNTQYLQDLPTDYLEINSGLGNAQPSHLLLIPLRFDNSVLGVLELASFHEIEAFKIEFLESLAQNIASAITTNNVNLRTRDLLSLANKQSGELKEKQEILMESNKDLAAQIEADHLIKNYNDVLKSILYESGYFISFHAQTGHIEEINKNMGILLGLNNLDDSLHMSEFVHQYKKFVVEISRLKQGKANFMDIKFITMNKTEVEKKCIIHPYSNNINSKVCIIYFHE